MNELRKFFCIIVHDTDMSAPVVLEADELEALQPLMHQELIAAKAGWCYIFEGSRLQLANAQQVFCIKRPDGSLSEVRDPNTTVFESGGRFTTLRPI